MASLQLQCTGRLLVSRSQTACKRKKRSGYVRLADFRLNASEISSLDSFTIGFNLHNTTIQPSEQYRVIMFIQCNPFYYPDNLAVLHPDKTITGVQLRCFGTRLSLSIFISPSVILCKVS